MLRSNLALPFLPGHPGPPVQWRVEKGLLAYPDALAQMDSLSAAIARNEAPETVWLVEHPPLYTAGTSARASDLLNHDFPVYDTGRGGQYTYHGPGQRVAYVMLDLNRRRPDIRAYVAVLESWIIGTLARMDIKGERREERVGVWVQRPDKPKALNGAMAEDKIAAIGIRVRRWVSLHGISLNVEPNLSHFGGIVPCGLSEAHLASPALLTWACP